MLCNPLPQESIFSFGWSNLCIKGAVSLEKGDSFLDPGFLRLFCINRKTFYKCSLFWDWTVTKRSKHGNLIFIYFTGCFL